VRTTLDIDDDVLQAARERARREKSTIGSVISELARRGLSPAPDPRGVAEPAAIYGLQPFAPRGGVVTNDLIDRLREDDVY
jgi:hypothetical protein